MEYMNDGRAGEADTRNGVNRLLFKSILLLCMLLAVACLAHPAFSQANFWQQMNGPFGGTRRALAIDSRGEIFASGSGIYKSTDNGNNWKYVGLSYPYFEYLVIDSADNLYAAS